MTPEKLSPVIQNPEDEDEIDLSEMVGTLIENRYLIVSVMTVFFVISVLYSFLSSPIYKADAVLQIDEQSSSMKGLDELDTLLGSESSSSVTEIEIIKSRKVIGGMVDKLNLTTYVEPNYFPLIGGYLARTSDSGQLTEPWLGFSSYAWGGEIVKVDRFEVPPKFLKKPFLLVAMAESRYVIFDAMGEKILEGEVGQPASNEPGNIQIFISQLVANEGAEFTLMKLKHNAVVGEYQKKIDISEKGKKSGILSVSLEGPDRMIIESVIGELTQGYLRQNVERKSEESEKMLQFISAQLPVLKSGLNAAEIALNHHREEKGTIDLSFESQNLIERITRLEAELSDLNLEQAALIQKLTPDHPVIQGIREKLKNLEQQKEVLNNHLFALPETELETVKFSRDVTVANELYMLLLNKSQELKVSKAGTIGSARIVDEAVVADVPVKPRKALIIAISLLLGFIVGVVVAALRKALNHTIDDPNIIEKKLGYAIYSEIPFSKFQAAMRTDAKAGASRSEFQVLAHVKGDEHDFIVESLRSLRTSIQFALMEAKNKVVTITGSSPEIGKSFISVNFAYLMAESGKKVLLIDGDMRKGHINHYFGLERSPGLSEAIGSDCEWQTVIQKGLLNENLDVLVSGTYPPNPSELLMGQRFAELLAKANEDYDLVVIDTPPVLAVTDAVIICQHSASNFMVIRSHHHHLRELQTAFKRFEQNGILIRGAIFNGIELKKAGYGYNNGYKYYGYQYK
ncbi:MAG: polysaccharide biosynthesis tyrosine autokinase [Gammaproteobacteria bacterium]|nr:polysaccharide biosynthesis tyrosine autokinase [Gammaproteobacteria bacterium]